ncbi:MAG TPA: hypothetical protein VK161_04170, partial [Flavobacterium sp.]|nr:hypothetical protein [Flavobacterium sp.]
MKTINKYSFIISILTLLVSSLTYAEGTPSLSPNSANITAVLVAPDILSGSYSNCPEDNRIYFNIANNATERIYFGFDWRGYSVGSPLRVTNMYYRIKNPSGVVVQTGLWNSNTGTAGSIDTYAQAIAGPNIAGTAPTGYTPLNYDPVVNGEHWIEFYRSDDNGVTANTQRGVAPYFDLTVATTAGVRRNGRVHSDKWGFVAVDSNFGNFITASSEPSFYAYTNDQVVLFINFRPGFQPIAYNLAVNSYGVTPTGPFNITRRSVNSTLSPSLPNGYKVFLNNPDSSVYPVAAVPAAPTFLDPAITGCGTSYQIRYNITSPGDVRLLIDLNGVAGYQPGTSDRLIEAFNVLAGNNTLNWNGLDGQGNLVPDGASMSLTLFFLAGRFNLPIYDAELNKNGFNVQSVAPIAIPNSQMYWDDTQLTNVGSSCLTDGSTQENNLTGAGWDNSLNGTPSPTRAWSANGNPTNAIPAPASGANETDGITCNDFGNVRVLNTWGWGLTNQSVATTVFKGCSDLRVVKTVSNAAPTIGSNVTFTITATNLGVSNDTNVVLNDLLPAGYTLVSATPSTGSYSSATGVWTIGNFNNLANATLTIVATVNVSGSYTNTATITGTNFDPNLANNTSSVTPVPVNAVINAVNDSGSSINGFVGGTSFTNVLVNDTLNGVAVVPSQVNTTFVSSTNPGVTLSGTNVVVAPGTPAGNYTLTYQICQIVNPTNCDTAIVTVPVTAPVIDAVNDAGTPVNGYNGGTAFTNVLFNDTLNGVAVVPSQVATTFVSSTNPGVTLSGTNVVVAPGTPAGNYTLTYQICQITNPTNCDTATVTVPVTAASIEAKDDTGNTVNGFVGGTSFTNVLVNDTLNGVAVIPSQVTTTFVSSTNPGVTLSGTNVVVAAGTPAGNYTLTYQICEVLNPTNCDTAVVTVPVTAPAIDAVNDSGASINGYVGGTSFTNVLVNDTLNGAPVVPSQVTTTFVSSTHPGVTLSGTNVVVAAGTPAGNYTLTYQICQNINPTNCDTAIVTVPVTAPVINAVNDAGTPVNGYNGGTSFTNVLVNDTLNGVAVIPSQVTTTFVSSTNPGVTLSGTNVVVAAGTPAGNYTLTYQICEVLNPTNCDTAVVTVPVTAASIEAKDDTGNSINGYTGGTSFTNVLVNDTLNGVAVVPSQVTTTFVSSTHPGVTLSGTNVVVAAGTPAGNYTLTYQICEVLNPTNCDTAVVTVPVTAAAINAVNDTGASVNGFTGGTSFSNVLGNDTLNGVAVIPSQVTTTFVSSTNPGVTLSGTNVVVAPGTPVGNYTLTYQICEILNPSNCDTAVVTVPVNAASIDAVNDTGSSINGFVGGTSFTNVLVNDTLNGIPVIASQVTTSFISSTHPGVTLSGTNVVVAAGTPAGNYTLTYQICENLNPTNCDTATVTVPVTAPVIDAVNDAGNPVNGFTGGTSFTNVLINDTLNGAPVVPSQVTTTFVSSTNPGVTLSGTNVVVAAGTPAGNYTLTYQICQILNPTNCDTAVVTVTVSAPVIDAVNDAGTPINSYVGGTALTNVLANDTLNGAPVVPSQVTTTFVSSTNPGVTLSGTNVVVAAGTPAGNYTLTYQICQITNPLNCDTAVVTVPVTAPAIVANDDNGSTINGYVGGTSFTNVLVNDTLNGAPVVPSQVTTTFISSTNPGVTLSGTNVVVAAGTPAGNYTLTYQICEIVNPTNCDTAIVTVPVSAATIDAVNDNGSPVNGYNGGTAFTNVLANDTLNGAPVVPSQVTTTFVSSTNPGVTLSGTNVVVAPGTPAGNYTLVYQICEILNPTNCDTATVTVPVNAAAIIANDDTGSSVNGYTGGTAFTNVLVNDTLNGAPVIASQVNTTFVSSTNPGVTLSGTNVVVAAGTPAGNYTLTYQICEILNPTNCDTAVVTVPVTAATIDAVNDAGTPVNGYVGGTTLTNVLANDTLNGVAVIPSQVTTTFVSSTNPGVTLSGTNVVVAAGTPAGNYTLTYQICEVLNPSNCDTATVTVPVTAAPIVANDDTGAPTNGYTGGTAFTNVLVNDTLNGVAVIPSQVTTTFVSSTNPGIILSGTNVVVAPGTPAGNYTLTYQICEVLKPTNCDTAVVTVPVNAAPIVANDDTGASVNGFTGGSSFTNVLGNDTLNGVPVLPSQVTTTFVSSTNPGVTLSGTNVVVAAGTPVGNYTLTYQICEILNPTNCDTAIVTVPVNAASIDAVNDFGTPVNGYVGGTSFTNILGNDTLNGSPVDPSQITTSFVSSTNPGVTLSGTNVVVAAGTPAGNYTLTYQICEILNPTNCDTATVTVPVTAATIVANDDAGSSINGLVGGTSFTNILANDTLNGNPVIPSQVTTTFVSSTNSGVTLSGTNVVVAPGTPAGNYILTYQICEVLNPANCDTAIVTVPVTAAAIDAVNDTIGSTNGTNGNPNAGNVLTSNGNGPDTLNGVPVTISQVTISVVTPATPVTTGAPVPTVDPVTGQISIPANTPAGNYTITYQICEILNPTNCDTAVV